MTCDALAARLNHLQPGLRPVEVARLCLLILNQVDDPAELADDQTLRRCWRSASFRLEAAADQHAAMTGDLDAMCGDGPVRFSPDQIWTLLRAVKVQSQILELYTGQPSLV